MAEKLAASSSQQFGLISLLFARSIGFLGKRLNNLTSGERRGKREEKTGKRDAIGFGVLRMGVRGAGLDILALLFIPKERLPFSQTFTT